MRFSLVVSEKVDLQSLSNTLNDFSFVFSSSLKDAIDVLPSKPFEYVLVDVRFLNHGTQIHEVFERFWSVYPSLEIVILSPASMIPKALEAVEAGARHYLTYPVDAAQIKVALQHAEQDKRLVHELDYLRDRFWNVDAKSILDTSNSYMRHVFDQVRSVSPTDTTVLLTGETGTGKGVIANLIHQHSKRRHKQFLSIHCGAIPETLLESELFGHEKGAFTGALRRRLGKFEIASGGTIFLDEIGTISHAMQIKLLQVLQEKRFQRVGGETTLQTDVRIIAASNADLKALCEASKFRWDLYYRLNVFPIHLPPLRERREDIPAIVEQILARLNRFGHKSIHQVDPRVMDALWHYEWPGNIRELENILERAFVLEKSAVLTPYSFPQDFFYAQNNPTDNGFYKKPTLKEIRRREIERIEKKYLDELLRESRGRISQTANAAGIGVRQLNLLMKKYGLRKENYKA